MSFKVFGRVTATLSLFLGLAFGLTGCGGGGDANDGLKYIDPPPPSSTAFTVTFRPGGG